MLTRTRRIALAAALGLALAPTAHASDPVLDWILVTMPTSGPVDKPTPALIQPWRYDLVGCAEEKGRVEATLFARFPKEHYAVLCAQVPGLRQ